MPRTEPVPPRIPRFRALHGGEVQQAIGTELTTFDPNTWATYRHIPTGGTVQACRLPGPFQVGGDLCRDGWLVVDRKGLTAVGQQTFAKDYELTLLSEAA